MQMRKKIKTRKSVITRMYSHQKENSIKRGHSPPSYTRDQLEEWVFKNNFEDLFINWQSSGYDKKLIPSCDRLDDSKGYSFSNIRLVTWDENDKKAHEQHRKGIGIDTNLKVIQIKDGNIIDKFISIRDAARSTGIKRQNITSCCKKKYGFKSAGGYQWEFDKEVLV